MAAGLVAGAEHIHSPVEGGGHDALPVEPSKEDALPVEPSKEDALPVEQRQEADRVNGADDDAVRFVPKSVVVLAWAMIAVSTLGVLFGSPRPGILMVRISVGIAPLGYLPAIAVLVASSRLIVVARRESASRRDSAERWYDRRRILALSPLVAVASWIPVLLLLFVGLFSRFTPIGVISYAVDGLLSMWPPYLVSDVSRGGPDILLGAPAFWILLAMSVAVALLMRKRRDRSAETPVAQIPWDSPRQDPNDGASTGNRSTNPFAIASFVLSLVGFIAGVGAILGVIFGYIALSQIKKSGQGGRGLALAGVIIGWIVIALTVAFILWVFNILGSL